jgi:hypothetical protein
MIFMVQSLFLSSLTISLYLHPLPLSVVVMYVGGRAVAETEYVCLHVLLLHSTGQTEDVGCRWATTGTPLCVCVGGGGVCLCL